VVDIEKTIDDALLQEQIISSQRTRSGKWSPSSFGRCYRYQFWNRKNIPQSNPVDVEALRRFKLGKLVHNFVQNFIPDKQTEVKVETDDVLGFADIVQPKKVIDIKSIRSFGFKKILKKDYDITLDKFSYILQLMSYVKFLSKKVGELFFVDTDSMKIKTFEFKIEDWEAKVDEELEVLRGFWKQDKLPPASPRAYGGKECKYCVFENECIKERGVL
jgi:hypothetical protein